MKFFIDTANVSEIREAESLGILDGVTTNPTLLARELDGREGASPAEILTDIAKIVSGPISAEVVSLDAEGMVREGLELRKIADNIVIKVPITLDGLKAIRRFSDEDIETNCTLIFSCTQALLAAKAGATYASPFVGRLDDISADGMGLIEKICAIYSNYELPTQVLVASVRHPEHVVQAGLLGADVVTMPLKVFPQLAKHPLTDLGLEQFLADWEKVKDR